MKKFCFLIFIFILIQNNFAQNIKKVAGTAQVRMEKNMTLEEAREKAKELAMIKAIENAFGTYVGQQGDMVFSGDTISYNIIGTTKVNGEWIGTTDIRYEDNFKTETGPYGKQQIRWVTCYIKGKARKTLSKANIEFEVLNTPDPASRTESFYDGEQLYLYFKSPVDGYLSVYLDDGNSAYCLLPDTYSPAEYASGVYVKGDEDYIFFSPKLNKLPQTKVEEYEMFTNKPLEYNTLYVIFSEQKFVKPVLRGKEKSADKILPRSLSREKFNHWLADQRAASTSFQDRKIKISIQTKKY